jgi:F-type H+-transporting ATPase subunit b
MLIDWFTVVAQIINFLVLVWLMKHFLYRPILNSIDQREKKIAQTVADAAKEKEDASHLKKDFDQKMNDIEAQKKVILDKAIAEAKKEQDRILETARSEGEEIKEKWQISLELDQKNRKQELIERTENEILLIARKMLTDLSNGELEDRITQVMLQKLSAIAPDLKTQFQNDIKNGAVVSVKSAFDLSSSQKESFKEVLEIDAPFKFSIEPSLICGIELSAGGNKIAWNVSDYLDSFQDKPEMNING